MHRCRPGDRRPHRTGLTLSEQPAWARFRALHAEPGLLLCGSAWDVGTARLIADCGYQAIETSSAGLAFATGRPDAMGLLSRDEILASSGAIARAVTVPVSADLENGFGDAPETVAETIRLADAAGLAGGSIEDATGRSDDPLYDLGLAADRIRAAVAAVGGRFVVTARCDAYMHRRGDLGAVISRLQAYQQAGADVLAAPGLPDKAAFETLVRSVDRPVAMFVGLSAWLPDAAEIAAVGIKRASVGSGLARVALTAFLAAAQEARENGRFDMVFDAKPFSFFNGEFRRLHGLV